MYIKKMHGLCDVKGNVALVTRRWWEMAVTYGDTRIPSPRRKGDWPWIIDEDERLFRRYSFFTNDHGSPYKSLEVDDLSTMKTMITVNSERRTTSTFFCTQQPHHCDNVKHEVQKRSSNYWIRQKAKSITAWLISTFRVTNSRCTIYGTLCWNWLINVRT